MIQFQPLSILVDWTLLQFEIAILSITYTFGDVFRSDSVFCIAWVDDEFYLEILGFVLLGEKGPQE